MEAPTSPKSEHINPWIIAIAVMLSTFMEVLDTTVVNVSLPHIAGSLSATVDEATWALTSYLLANAVILPITGWLASVLGRQRLLMIAVSVFIFAPSYIRRMSSRIDYWGIGMLAVGVASLQIVLDKGQEEDWFGSHWIATLAVVSIVALATLVIYELHAGHPVLDLQVFRLQTYSAGVSLMTIMGVVLYGSLVMLPIMLQTLLGYTALQAGLAMFPRGLGSFLAMPFVGGIMRRVDPRRLLWGGIIACSGSL